MLTDDQRRALAALADTYVAAVPGEADAFLARTGSQVGAPAAVEMALDQLPAELGAGLAALLGALAATGLADTPPASREALVEQVAAGSPVAGLAVLALRALILSCAYTVVDGTGGNPFWHTIGYPAPGTGPALPATLRPRRPPLGEDVTADVVVLGSGAGGGVVAAELARAGRSVVVLEAGGYHDGEYAVQQEIYAAPAVFYRSGGFTTTAEGNVNLWAGATLGGGTTVNWSNCVPTPPRVRRAWATRHGLSGVDGTGFDAHLDAVLARIGANDDASVYNGANRVLVDGARALGWSHRRALLNLDPKLLEPERGALLTYGDRTGAKQGTLRTYLVDAVAAGARLFIHTRAERVLLRDGQAAGVLATCRDPDGRHRPVTVHAGTVVLACGALETPALLARSGLGGPAAGRHLHLHPSILLSGEYPDRRDPWEGPIQSAIVDEFAEPAEPASPILIETVAAQVGATAATLPWTGAAEHKRQMARMAYGVALVAIVGDRGGGTVDVDGAGEAVHRYPVEDPRDRAALYAGLEKLARLHAAAGAVRIWPLTPAVAAPAWQRGEDLHRALAAWHAIPLGFGGHYLGSAHQMGSARMGTDPATSVARPTGELHGVCGVWIGDTSAFPTALGVNPMVTCMALARRTAAHILG